MSPSPFQIAPRGLLPVLLAILVSSQFILAQDRDVEDLGSAVVSGTVEEKREALYQLRVIGTPEASEAAVPALKDLDDGVRAAAVYSVLALGNARAADLLMPMLEDRSVFVIAEAALALGRTRKKIAETALLRVLSRDKKREVRGAAALALGQAGGTAAVSGLVEALRRNGKEKDSFIRRSAARSIGQIARRLRSGSEVLTTPESFLPDEYKESGSAADYEPSLFNDAVTALIAVLSDRKEASDTKREAVFALGEIGDSRALPAIRALDPGTDPVFAEIIRDATVRISARAD